MPGDTKTYKMRGMVIPLTARNKYPGFMRAKIRSHLLVLLLVLEGKKESGRQFHMLQAFHLADALTGNRYQAMEKLMLKVALAKAYYPQGRGIVYEMAPDWSLLTMKNGQREDWVTSEAMGVALLALLGLGEGKPW